jgi:APA family basic amino acid/polyamine antiporter
LAAFCYAELASMMPRAGSAYSYAYGIFGELAAWIIGWDLILEYGMGAATVAAGWSFYLQDLLRAYGLALPHWASGPPFGEPGRVINLPAAVVVMGFAVLLIFRTRLNALIARGLVVVKLCVIAFNLALGVFYIQPANWTPLIPFGSGSIIQAASLVFFASLGFDVVAITAEESKRPEHDVPFGIIGSLTLCSIIYLAVALVLVGLGAIVGITSVLYMLLLAQPPRALRHGQGRSSAPAVAALHPHYQTPPPHDPALRGGRGPGSLPYLHRKTGLPLQYRHPVRVLPGLPGPDALHASQFLVAAGPVAVNWSAIYFLYDWRAGRLGGGAGDQGQDPVLK